MVREVRDAFFTYEKNFAARWIPVVYWDEVPKLKKEDVGCRSAVWPVEADDFDAGDEPNFGRLKAKHPAPVEASLG